MEGVRPVAPWTVWPPPASNIYYVLSGTGISPKVLGLNTGFFNSWQVTSLLGLSVS